MEISAGLLIIYNNKILLGHPTNSPDFGSYTIPKGKIEKNETDLQAAIRETEEEIGIKINIDDIININNPNIIEYKNDKNIVYKILKYFIVKPKNEIIIDSNKLQKSEIDWAGFLDKYDSLSKIFWRFEEMINYIK